MANNFEIDDWVRIKLPYGSVVKGQITSKRAIRTYLGKEYFLYGILTKLSPKPEFYEEWYLEAANPEIEYKCSCGSDKLSHPGHSFWCIKFKEVTIK